MSRGLGLLINVHKIVQGNHWKKEKKRKCVLRKIRSPFPEASCEPTSVSDDDWQLIPSWIKLTLLTTIWKMVHFKQNNILHSWGREFQPVFKMNNISAPSRIWLRISSHIECNTSLCPSLSSSVSILQKYRKEHSYALKLGTTIETVIILHPNPSLKYTHDKSDSTKNHIKGWFSENCPQSRSHILH